MIIDNRIILGYGTILVGANYDGTIRVQHIDPNAVIGQSITEEFSNNMKILKAIKLSVMPDLLHKLNHVTEQNPIIYHDNYIMDFTEFNVGSVNAFIRQTKSAINAIQMTLAC